MKKILMILGSMIIIIFVIMFSFGIGIFSEKVNYSYQKKIDNISYERLKKVEDTARAMIANYNADKQTYEIYKSNNEELAIQAKIRANRTASAYNEYMLKNSFQWQNNIPSDIYIKLEFIK